MKHTLVITKVEYTLNGTALDSKERYTHRSLPTIGGIQNQDVVRHETILFSKAFTTIKAAWAYATPELIDKLGLFWNGRNYDTEYADYIIFVEKV